VTSETAAIWRSFGDRLRRFIRKSVPHEADADDVLQDVFARIQEGIDSVRDSERLEAWIFQVTRFAIIDHLRSRKRNATSLDAVPEPEEVPPERDMNSLVASWLRPLMGQLSEEDREALKLTSLEGRSQKELATALKLSPTGARSRVQRARARLKEVLHRCCEVERDRRGNAIAYTRRQKSCGDCSCD
jgi:RNA polymerase sigma-70 factor (ECF subfamily)